MMLTAGLKIRNLNINTSIANCLFELLIEKFFDILEKKC